MSHFAKIENGMVTKVIVAEQHYVDTLNGQWIQTSYNANIRKNYAGIGYTYDAGLDAFIPPSPYASWTLNESTCLWEAPVAMPTDGKIYQWDEQTTNWIEVK
jgi:hypothetical protein